MPEPEAEAGADPEKTASRIEQAAGKLAAYRDQIMTASRGARVGILIAALTLILFSGLAINALRPVVGRGITFVIAWTVLLFVLYTLYALGRSVVANVRS